MKKIFLTVGPSQLYPTVPKHLKSALKGDIYSLNHRGEKFAEINKQTQAALRKLLNIPKTHHIFYTASALEAMERTIQNTVLSHSFHIVNGAFSEKFYQIATDLNKKTEKINFAPGKGFDLKKVKVPKHAELITLVQNETSSGYAIPMEDIYDLKDRYPDKLLAIDVVSSAPYPNIDFTKIDLALFSVQKGFGLPAGLGLLIVHEKTLEKAEKIKARGISIGSYHTFPKIHSFAQKWQTSDTPNVINIYLLGKVTADMLEKGLDDLRKDIDTKAELLYKFFDARKGYSIFTDNLYRSKTILVIDVPKNSEILYKKLAAKGFIVSRGYGANKERQIRIANFPALSVTAVKKFLRTFEEIA